MTWYCAAQSWKNQSKKDMDFTALFRKTNLTHPTDTSEKDLYSENHTNRVERCCQAIRIENCICTSLFLCLDGARERTLRPKTRTQRVIREILIGCLFGSRAESVCELVRVGKLTCNPVTFCDSLHASLFAVCGVSVKQVSHSWHIVLDTCAFTTYHCTPSSTVIFDHELVSRFEDVHRGHRDRESDF